MQPLVGVAPKIKILVRHAANLSGVIFGLIAALMLSGAYVDAAMFGTDHRWQGIWQALLFAAVSFSAALLCWRQYRALPISIVGVAFCAYFSSVSDDWPSMEAYKEDGNRVIAALDHYRDEHDAYPRMLAEAGIALPPSPCSPWEYHVSDDLQSFRLDLHANKWPDDYSLIYNSVTGTWCDID